MAATQGITTPMRRKQSIDSAQSRINTHNFGVDTAEELHSRLDHGDSHESDVAAMLADVRAILNGDQGIDALAGFSETLMKIATRNSKSN